MSASTRTVIGGVLLVFLSGPAMAQNVTGDVAFGYSALKDNDIHDWFAKGWVASGAANVSRSWQIVGEATRHSQSPQEARDFGIDFSLHLLGFGAGPRFITRQPGRLQAFAQVLVGGTRVSFSSSLPSCGAIIDAPCLSDDASTSRTGFAVQPGGGLDMGLTRSVFVRVQGDYRMFRIEGENAHEFRVAVGIAYKFGVNP
jgi:hypothetical protein